jgi:hypothetical protein
VREGIIDETNVSIRSCRVETYGLVRPEWMTVVKYYAAMQAVRHRIDVFNR